MVLDYSSKVFFFVNFFRRVLCGVFLTKKIIPPAVDNIHYFTAEELIITQLNRKFK